jgi:hypothetical protein
MPAIVATFRVVIKDGIHARVRPACDVSNMLGGKFIFKNNSDDQIKVFLPGWVFSSTNAPGGAIKKKPFTIPVAAQAQEEVFISNNVDARKGLFSFRVWCEETNSFADGNSDPEFIVEN